MMSDLMPCPFCGGKPERFGPYDAVRCAACSENGGWMSAKNWNTRDASEVRRLEGILAGAKASLEKADDRLDSPSGVTDATAALMYIREARAALSCGGGGGE